MTDLLIVAGLGLLLSPLLLVSAFVYAPVLGLVLIVAGLLRSAGEVQ